MIREKTGAYYRGNMYCSPRDTRSRAHCDRLTVTEYTMCVSYCTGRLGLITGGTCIVHPGTRAPEHTATDLLSQNIRCVCHIEGETSGAYYRGNMYCSPRDTRSRAPCDRLTVTEYTIGVSYCMGRLLGTITGNTYAVYPGTRRSRGPCDMLAVKAHTVCY